MKTAAVVLSLIASASAFAPATTNSRSSVAVQESKADLEALAAELVRISLSGIPLMIY